MTLRQASLQLCLAWLNNPKNPSPENLREDKNLQLAFTKFDHYSATINNAKGHLENYLFANNENDYIHKLFQMLLKPPFHEFAIDMVAKLDKDKLPWIIKILDKFHSEPSERGPWVKEWISRLQILEKNEMAGEAEEYWKKLENSSFLIESLKQPKNFDDNIFL